MKNRKVELRLSKTDSNLSTRQITVGLQEVNGAFHIYLAAITLLHTQKGTLLVTQSLYCRLRGEKLSLTARHVQNLLIR